MRLWVKLGCIKCCPIFRECECPHKSQCSERGSYIIGNTFINIYSYPSALKINSFSEIIENVLDSTDSYEKEGKIAAGKIINYLKDDITRVNIQDDSMCR